MDSKVLKNFGGVDDAQFLNEIKKERPYFAVLAEKASETVDSIFLSRSSTKEEAPPQTGVAKPRVSFCCSFRLEYKSACPTNLLVQAQACSCASFNQLPVVRRILAACGI